MSLLMTAKRWYAGVLPLVLLLGSVGCARGGYLPGELPEDDGDPGDPGGPSDAGSESGRPRPGNDAATPPSDPGPELPLVKDLEIAEVALFQGVKVPLAKDGAKVTTRLAAAVAGREGLLRVYVRPASGFSPCEVTGRLALYAGAGGPKILKSAPMTPSGASTDASLGSTVNFVIPTDAIAPDSSYVVWLMASSPQAGGTSTTHARYPESATPEALDARNTGEALKIKLVPIRYGADGSNRLPDTSPGQLEIYRRAAYALYPARKVEISVRAPFDYGASIMSDTEWETAITAVEKLRADDKVPPNVYYHAIFEPVANPSDYTAGIDGLCGLSPDPADATVRACLGLGYSGDYYAQIMTHEVGHAHGREHAPCGGAGGPDPKFPYSGGTIGAWGYDVASKTLYAPSSTDIMGYCWPGWISDYNFGAFVERMAWIASAKAITIPYDAPRTFRVAHLSAGGSVRWGDTITLSEPPLSEPRVVTLADSKRATIATVTGHYYKWDHLPGGTMLVPDEPLVRSAVRVSIPDLFIGSTR